MLLENQLFPHFSLMNSPQPPAEAGQVLSALQAGSFAKIAHRAIFKRPALQRGVKKIFSPFFCSQENPACGIDEVSGAGGLSSCI